MGGIDIRIAGEYVLARAYGHDDFLKRRVARAFSEPVDRALYLSSPGHDRRQRIGHRQPEVVVTMHREHSLVSVRHAFYQPPDRACELLRHVIADSVRNIDRTRARIDNRLYDATQEIDLRAPRVFGRELDVVAVASRLLHGPDSAFEYFVGTHAQFFLHMDR